jgi:O-succinylbenzoic acid--CoA ligase
LRAPGFSSLCDDDGWWRSGDAADLSAGLCILGRLDGAVHSGGETVFPEQLEARLLQAAAQAHLPVQALLLLGVEDPEWGERLVALVRSTDPSVLPALQQLTLGWPAADRPRRWLQCPELEPSAAGKWQRQRWRDWLRAL